MALEKSPPARCTSPSPRQRAGAALLVAGHLETPEGFVEQRGAAIAIPTVGPRELCLSQQHGADRPGVSKLHSERPGRGELGFAFVVQALAGIENLGLAEHGAEFDWAQSFLSGRAGRAGH